MVLMLGGYAICYLSLLGWGHYIGHGFNIFCVCVLGGGDLATMQAVCGFTLL